MDSRTVLMGFGAVALATASLVLWPKDGRQVPEIATGPDRAPASASSKIPPADAAELIRIRRSLTDGGLANDAAAAMLLAYLENRFRGQVRAAPVEYWRPTAVREARQRSRRFEVASYQRRSLRQAFGDEVASDAAYAAAFRPYEDRLPFLAQAEQEALQELADVADQVLVAASGPLPMESTAVRQARRNFDAALARLLPPANRAVYDLRESPLSRSLADSGFDFTRLEFDKAFAVLAARPAEAGDNPLPRRFDAGTLAQLRPVLGDARFAAYERQQSPLYQLVRTVVVGHGTPGTEVDTVYDLVREYWTDEAAEGGRPVRSIEGHARWTKRQSERNERLRALIGGDATAILDASLASNRFLLGVDGSGRPLTDGSAPATSVKTGKPAVRP